MQIMTATDRGLEIGAAVQSLPKENLGFILAGNGYNSSTRWLGFSKQRPPTPRNSGKGDRLYAASLGWIEIGRFYVLEEAEKGEDHRLMLVVRTSFRLVNGCPQVIAAGWRGFALKTAYWHQNTEAVLILKPGDVMVFGPKRQNYFIFFDRDAQRWVSRQYGEYVAKFGIPESLKRPTTDTKAQHAREPAPVSVSPVPEIITATGSEAKLSANGHSANGATATATVAKPLVVDNGQVIEIDGVKAAVTLENGLIVVTNL